jgi:hypothetical protein
MDNRFLDKVVDQIVSETTIDYEKERFLPPSSTSTFSSFHISRFTPLAPYPFFIIHCEEVYGLNKDEVKYVWDKYRHIIKDKLPY